MIREIVEFMNANDGIEEYFIANEPPKAYEHFYLKIDNTNNEYSISKKSTFWIYDDLNKHQKEFIKYMTYYQKALFNKALDRIHGLKGSNPYILTLDIDFDGKEYRSNINDFKEPKNKDKYSFNRIEKHFNDAKKYIQDNDSLEKLKIFLLNNLEKTIYQNLNFIQFMKDKLSDKKEVSITLRVYVDFENLNTSCARNFNKIYLKDKVFLSSNKNFIHNGQCSICNDNTELSLPSFLNTTGDDFGMKLTMPIHLPSFVCKNCSVKLYKFKVMTDNNLLTKPFPLFIDKKNLFANQKSVLDSDTKKKKYREIIKSIYYSNPKDLKNYYLVNYDSVWNKGNKTYDLKIKDLDYIENFQYMTTLQIENFLKIKNGFILNDFYDKELSIFQFEKIINELVFQKNLQRHYFSDYKDIKITYWKIDSSNSNNLLKNYLIKYRQNFYDYIYKSHQSALALIDFREMLLDIIIDNIRHDKTKEKNGKYFSIYETEIKEKLNLLFSLNQKKETNLDSGEFKKLKIKMRDSLGYWQDSLELKADGKTFKKEFIGGVEFIEEDDRLYAFLCGQLARFLIGKKKGKEENKSHADFSGFTEWQTSKLLKEYMWEIHRKYAHELKFDKKYDNAMSIIMTYRDDLEIEDVMEYMIAGYFSNNQIKYQNDNIEEN